MAGRFSVYKESPAVYFGSMSRSLNRTSVFDAIRKITNNLVYDPDPIQLASFDSEEEASQYAKTLKWSSDINRTSSGYQLTVTFHTVSMEILDDDGDLFDCVSIGSWDFPSEQDLISAHNLED